MGKLRKIYFIPILVLLVAAFQNCSSGFESGSETPLSINKDATISSVNSVSALVLVNTGNGSDIRELSENDTIELTEFNHGLSIRAEGTSTVTIAMVNGREVNRGPDKSLSGQDSQGNFNSFDFSTGTIEISFIPSTKINGKWTRGQARRVTLSVSNTPRQDNAIVGLFLINTGNGDPIRELQPRDSIDLADYNHGLTILAESTSEVTLARVNNEEVNRNARRSKTLNGIDSSGNYIPYDFQEGNIAVSFTPSSRIGGVWTEGAPVEYQLSVVDTTSQEEEPPAGNPGGVKIQRLVLVNTDNGSDVKTLRSGDSIDLEEFNHGLSIRAVTSADVTIAEVDGVEENRGPDKSLFGQDANDKFNAYPFEAGPMNVSFTPSSRIDGVWTPGTPYTVALNVMGSPVVEPPSNPPPMPPTPPNNDNIDADIIISGDKGESQYRTGASGAKVFDARQAKWTVDNCGWEGTRAVGGQTNGYPVLLESKLSGMKWYGGRWDSKIPQSVEWITIYNCPNTSGRTGNSAALFTRGSSTIEGVRIDGAWDGVRTGQDAVLRHSWISNGRDDGIEADSGQGLTIEDVLFDNNFVGVSSTPSGNSSKRIKLDRVLIKIGNYSYNGGNQPGAFIKCRNGTGPIEIRNSVFAFSKTSSVNNNNPARAWGKISGCSNNLLLWLADGPIPSSFPMPPSSCFQVKRGAEARQIWESRRNQFINNFRY